MAAARFRINDDKMADLRELVRAGWPQRRIAAVLGVSQPSISEAVTALRIPHRPRRGWPVR
jgi:predicted XRE-type DNA-binding protein